MANAAGLNNAGEFLGVPAAITHRPSSHHDIAIGFAKTRRRLRKTSRTTRNAPGTSAGSDTGFGLIFTHNYTPLVRNPPSTTMVSPVVKLAESLIR